MLSSAVRLRLYENSERVSNYLKDIDPFFDDETAQRYRQKCNMDDDTFCDVYLQR